MKRPARIRLLGKPFSVDFVALDHPGLRDSPEDTEPGMGRQETDNQRIFIREGQPLESEQDTVLHEVIHCIEEMLGLDMTEEQVTKLAMGLLAAIKDNPSFVRYLAAKKVK